LAQSEATFERLVAQLQAEAPDDFVARRTALVRDLRKRGERDLAALLAALRRPPLSVWAANRLHEVASRELEDLLATGARLREAQFAALEARPGGGVTREFAVLVSAHSAAVAGAVDASVRFLARSGRDASDPVRRRLYVTLREASLGRADRQAELAEGRLTADLEPEGFGGFGNLVPMPAQAPAEPAEPPEPPESEAPEPDRAAAAREARQAADEQQRTAREARTQAHTLRTEAERLEGEAREAAGAAAEAERRAAEEERQAETLEREARSYEDGG
jgi:hypothetical protein